MNKLIIALFAVLMVVSFSNAVSIKQVLDKAIETPITENGRVYPENVYIQNVNDAIADKERSRRCKLDCTKAGLFTEKNGPDCLNFQSEIYVATCNYDLEVYVSNCLCFKSSSLKQHQ